MPQTNTKRGTTSNEGLWPFFFRVRVCLRVKSFVVWPACLLTGNEKLIGYWLRFERENKALNLYQIISFKILRNFVLLFFSCHQFEFFSILLAFFNSEIFEEKKRLWKKRKWQNKIRKNVFQNFWKKTPTRVHKQSVLRTRTQVDIFDIFETITMISIFFLSKFSLQDGKKWKNIFPHLVVKTSREKKKLILGIGVK